jgi:hypothetical protein
MPIQLEVDEKLFPLILEFLYTGKITKLEKLSLYEMESLLQLGMEIFKNEPINLLFRQFCEAYLTDCNDGNLNRYKKIALNYRLSHLQNACFNKMLKKVYKAGDFSSQWLITHIRDFPDLTAIDLGQMENLSIKEIRILTTQIPHLRGLSLRHCNWVNKEVMFELQKFQVLEELDLSFHSSNDYCRKNWIKDLPQEFELLSVKKIKIGHSTLDPKFNNRDQSAKSLLNFGLKAFPNAHSLECYVASNLMNYLPNYAYEALGNNELNKLHSLHLIIETEDSYGGGVGYYHDIFYRDPENFVKTHPHFKYSYETVSTWYKRKTTWL